MTTKTLLTIYLNAADRMGDFPLHEEIVRRLLRFHIAGATVTRGVMGYGRHGHLHGRHLFGVSDDQPIIITAIDADSQIRPILPELRALLPDGLITLQSVEIA